MGLITCFKVSHTAVLMIGVTMLMGREPMDDEKTETIAMSPMNEQCTQEKDYNDAQSARE